MIIGISGKKQSGKSTIINSFQKHLQPLQTTVIRFADSLKEIVLNHFVPIEWNLSVDDLDSDEVKNRVLPCRRTIRELLQIIGTDLFRDIDPNCWVRSYAKKVFDSVPPVYNLYILTPDVRFLNEIDAIHNLGGVVIRLTRAPFGNIDQHKSEIALDEFTFGDYKNNPLDCIFDNRDCTVEESDKWVQNLIDGGGLFALLEKRSKNK